MLYPLKTTIKTTPLLSVKMKRPKMMTAPLRHRRCNSNDAGKPVIPKSQLKPIATLGEKATFYENASALRLILSSLVGMNGVYLFTNKLNGSQYVGSFRNLSTRLHAYYQPSGLRNGSNSGMAIAHAILKHGIENFSVSLLLVEDPSEAYKIEQRMLSTYRLEYNVKRKVGEVSPVRAKRFCIPVFIYDSLGLKLLASFPSTFLFSRFAGINGIQAKGLVDSTIKLWRKTYLIRSSLIETADNTISDIKFVPVAPHFDTSDMMVTATHLERGKTSTYSSQTACAKALGLSNKMLSKNLLLGRSYSGYMIVKS